MNRRVFVNQKGFVTLNSIVNVWEVVCMDFSPSGPTLGAIVGTESVSKLNQTLLGATVIEIGLSDLI